jgi:hypothetical protein
MESQFAEQGEDCDGTLTQSVLSCVRVSPLSNQARIKLHVASVEPRGGDGLRDWFLLGSLLRRTQLDSVVAQEKRAKQKQGVV